MCGKGAPIFHLSDSTLSFPFVVICCLLRFGGAPRAPLADLLSVAGLLGRKRESEICPDRDYHKYDAAGIALATTPGGGEHIRVAKAEGHLRNLEEKMERGNKT